LKPYPYIKLNKRHSLRANNEFSRQATEFLIKANEELRLENKKCEEKLSMSKKIIREKEDMLNH
jgi:hypothetical protein